MGNVTDADREHHVNALGMNDNQRFQELLLVPKSISVPKREMKNPISRGFPLNIPKLGIPSCPVGVRKLAGRLYARI